MEEVDSYIPHHHVWLMSFPTSRRTCISVRGRGTVVTGKIEQGKVQIEII
jgi:translation elongation factor EF-Tu-like GTPase